MPLVLAASTRLEVAKDRTLLKQHGGRLELKQSCCNSLMEHMGYVQRRGSTRGSESFQIMNFFGLSIHSLLNTGDD